MTDFQNKSLPPQISDQSDQLHCTASNLLMLSLIGSLCIWIIININLIKIRWTCDDQNQILIKMISSSHRALPSTSQPSCIIDPIDLLQKLQLLSLEEDGIRDLCLFKRLAINLALAPQRCYFEPPEMLIFKEAGLSKFSSSFAWRNRQKVRYFQRLVTPMMIWLGQKQQTLMCLHSLASDRRIYWCKDATLIMQGT